METLKLNEQAEKLLAAGAVERYAFEKMGDQHYVLKTTKKLPSGVQGGIKNCYPNSWKIEFALIAEPVKSPKAKKESAAKGIKFDTEKTRLDLLSAVWIEGVGKVLTYGARKYAAHNWRNGIERSRLLGAALRHIFSYLNGEDRDPETGLLHLYHASCCLMFASELHFTRPDLDDRYGVNQKGAK